MKHIKATDIGSPFRYLIILVLTLFCQNYNLEAQHHTGEDCINCHNEFKIGGTIFTDHTASSVAAGETLKLIAPNGTQTILNSSNEDGNIHETILADGNYLIRIGDIISRTWHSIPTQGSCNSCHTPGGNGEEMSGSILPQYHTEVTPGNSCTDCHHYPATMSYSNLNTEGVLSRSAFTPEVPGSKVNIGGVVYDFDPDDHSITSVRPDVFAPGYFSMFDVILAVAAKNDIPVEYQYDSTRKTHFITNLNNVSGEYWYHFSYDAGSGNSNEIRFRRENRWDETLWRDGVWIKVVDDEPLDEIKAEYFEEIQREQQYGNMIPRVRIRLNPTDYNNNPPESNRITVTKTFQNVEVTAHNYRATGFESSYTKPFQPGVITSMDILLSLKDQGHLTVVTGAFYTRFASHFIDSYYIVEMGFPVEGIAHSSGRQGFTYTTGNGNDFRLANEADNKFHILSDIAVLHAPDFSSWKWTELGTPYYESELDSSNTSIIEDYNAMDRGFNLHQPYPNPLENEILNISFNIFEPEFISIDMLDSRGVIIAKLYANHENNLGIHRVSWNADGIAPGQYFVRMVYGNHQQIRRVNILK